MTRIEQEKNTVAKMVHIYCKYHERNRKLCNECQQLLEYAQQRLNYCKFGENKPTCRKCPIHCYKPDMRKKNAQGHEILWTSHDILPPYNGNSTPLG